MSVWKKGYAFVQHILSLKIPVYASHAGYFIVLSVFPTLVLLLSLLRYTGLNVNILVDALNGFIPAALMGEAKQLILSTYYNTSGGLVSVSAVTALWSASRGIYGLLNGMNSVYQVQESRGYFRLRGICFLYTFLFLVVLLLTLILHVFGAALSRAFSLPGVLHQMFDLRFFLLLFVQVLVFTAMYMVLPNRKNRFFDSLPGGLLAASGWLIFSDLYSVYVEKFAKFSNVYGSVYAVALSMLWLYCCISIVFYGGALNDYLTDHKKS